MVTTSLSVYRRSGARSTSAVIATPTATRATSSLSTFNSAAQMRDIIRSYAHEVVDEQRPQVRYATVISVHATLRVAFCQWPGEAPTFPVPYGSAQPFAGQTVRISGRPGALYIEDVLSVGINQGDDVPSGGKIFHRIAGKDILTIQNPNNPTTLGGWVMQMHPGHAGAYLTLHPASYAATAYVLLADGTNSFVSANTGGAVFIRAGANDGAHQVQVHSAGVNVAGTFNTDGAANVAGALSVTGAITGASYVRAEGGYVSSDTDTYVRNYFNGTSKTGHRIRIGPWASDTGWTCYIGNCGYFLLDHVSSTSNAHLRAYSTLRIGGNSDDQLIINNGGVTSTVGFSAYAVATTMDVTAGRQFISNAGPCITNWVNSAGGHTSMGMQARSGGLVCGYAAWVTPYGFAPTMQVNGGVGEMFEFKNNNATDYNWIKAGDFVKPSSRDLKVNVRSATSEHRDKAYEALKNVRTVVYDAEVGELHIRGNERFRDVNRRWKAMGHQPLELSPNHIESVPHDCTESDKCCGTAEVPCGAYTRSKDQRGFIAEELMTALPKAIAYDLQNEPMGISYAVITTELWDIVAHLVQRIETLEAELPPGHQN